MLEKSKRTKLIIKIYFALLFVIQTMSQVY